MDKLSPVRQARTIVLFDRVMRLSQYSTENERFLFDFNTFTTGVSLVHIVGDDIKANFICWLDVNDEYGNKLAELEAYIDAEEKRFMEAENNDKDTV